MSDKRSLLCIWSDGGARGNPGPAGIGFVIKYPDGRLVKEYCEYLGVATNNIAEYMALIKSLEFAQHIHGTYELEIFLDSELVVKQIKGEYKVKNEGLKPLFLRARELLSGFTFSIAHIARSKNKEADSLVNRAIDEHGQSAGDSEDPSVYYQSGLAQGKLF